MKASELRIGNAVFVGGKIKWVNHRLISDLASDPEQRGRKDGYKITPIPLTEERLVRMGFEKHADPRTINLVKYILKVSEGVLLESIGTASGELVVLCICAGNYFANNIRYVHQLQNLVHALKGEELTLTPAVVE